jgi:hypothetical protein
MSIFSSNDLSKITIEIVYNNSELTDMLFLGGPLISNLGLRIKVYAVSHLIKPLLLYRMS